MVIRKTCAFNISMYLKLVFVLFLPVTLTEEVNKTKIAQYRKDFMKQMIDGIPFLPVLSLQAKMNKPNKLTSGPENDTVTYYLYNRQNPLNSIVINNDLSLVNPKLPVKLLVHGWTEHYDVEWCKKLTAAYLKKGFYNVIVLDWSSRGDADYFGASFAVPEVGNAIGDFIVNRLYRARKVPLERIHLVSHSLGCHVAGLTGQRVIKLAGKPLGRITALDPAAPYFDLFTLQKDDRLSPDDAAMVDIVHTDGGWLGFKSSLGTTDFFPNGGSAVQPGCSLLKADVQYEDLFCSHARSHKFFTRSVTQKGMKAVPCESWAKFDQGACTTNEINFGDDAPTNITGNYFLRTPEDIS